MEKLNEKEFYKQKIIEIVKKVENQNILEYLYSFIQHFLQKYK